MDYNTLYEYLRKEKYGEQLQQLPKDFVAEFASYLKEKKELLSGAGDSFSVDEETIKLKKQLENAISIFRELMLRRKKKILSLVFVASETGIMKRDFGTMLQFEQSLFENLVSAVESADKDLTNLMHDTRKDDENKMVLIMQPLSAFVDMGGNLVGPFEKGQLVNMDAVIADILVSEKKASLVDKN